VLTCEINAGLGRVSETLDTLTGPFDLIFVDADTRNYVRYYHRSLELLAPYGTLLMDNTQGITLGPVDPSLDPATVAVQELPTFI
jgi:predicted O-methyltransferase YrrM